MPSGHEIMVLFLSKPGFLLARVDQICTALYGELSAGETLAQAELLLAIEALDAESQVALARAAGVDTSTTGIILANLCARHWVARGPDRADRRRALVALTGKGAAAAARVAADYAELQARLTAPLGAAARDRLVAMLRRIAVNPHVSAPAYAPAAAPLDDAPSFLCRRAMQLFQGQFIAGARAFGLTPRQYSLLVILTQLPEITQVGFARLFGLDPSTCAVIMRGLDKRGLLASAPSPADRRARAYRLTEAGARIVSEAAPFVDESERLALGGIEAEEARWLVAQLGRLVHAHSHRLRFPGALAAPLPAREGVGAGASDSEPG